MDNPVINQPAGLAFPATRRVDGGAPWRWLKAGSRDLRQCGPASLFYGACFALAGWLLYFVFKTAYALFAGLTTGFLLVGPLLALGLYDLSRQAERGQPPRLGPSLLSWRPNLSNVALLAGVLTVVMLLWARASMVTFALFFDGGLPTFASVVHAVLTLEQPEFTLVYFAVGGFFALFVFAISVVSVPMMLDRNTDAITAGIASIDACLTNPGPMLLWAGTIVALVALGFATLFLGLVLAVPLVGHATWHAYRELLGPAPAATDDGAP